MSGFAGHYEGATNGQFISRPQSPPPPPNHNPPQRLGKRMTDTDSDASYTNPYFEQKIQTQGLLKKGNIFGGNNHKKEASVAIHRPRLNRKTNGDDKNLNTNFDPMKDRHMWAMWRTAVNGRIVDQVRRNEQYKNEVGGPPESSSTTIGSEARTSTYGKDLANDPPLSRFIRLNQRSKNIAQDLMNEGHGELQTTQFIYYGLPRVTINTNHLKTKNTTNVNGDGSNNSHYANIGVQMNRDLNTTTNDYSSYDAVYKNVGSENNPYNNFSGR